MEWLFGGTVITCIAGAVALGIYLAKMAANNRSDLHLLVQSEKDLADARRDIDGYQRIIPELQSSLARERAAMVVAREALGAATKKLAARGDASSVAIDINSTLSELSKMSAVSETEAP
jgi:hypothetical protein